MPEGSCTPATPERKYYRHGNLNRKRCLRPSEYLIRQNCEVIISTAPREDSPTRLQHCTIFVTTQTFLSQGAYEAFEDAQGAYWLITEFSEGVNLADLPEDKKSVVIRQLELHLQTLQSLKSSIIGGRTGIVIPTYRVSLVVKQDVWQLEPSKRSSALSA